MMTSDTTHTRFPLSWPVGWVRTRPMARRRASFGRVVHAPPGLGDSNGRRPSTRALTMADAIERLAGELARLGATDEILSTNVPVRLDGLPRSNQPEPTDPGAAVYFRLKKQDRCLACDRWTRTADNVAAIAQHIDALRRIDRYGVGTIEQAFAGYAALPPASHAAEWWVVLGVHPSANLDGVDEAFRALARRAHPDAGGSHDEMARLTEARERARKALA